MRSTGLESRTDPSYGVDYRLPRYLHSANGIEVLIRESHRLAQKTKDSISKNQDLAKMPVVSLQAIQDLAQKTLDSVSDVQKSWTKVSHDIERLLQVLGIPSEDLTLAILDPQPTVSISGPTR